MKEVAMKQSVECEKILDKIDELASNYDIDLCVDVWLEESCAAYTAGGDTYEDFENGFRLAVDSIKQNKQVFYMPYCNDSYSSYSDAMYYFLAKSEKELINTFSKKLKETEKQAEQYKEDEEKWEQEQVEIELQQAKQAKEAAEKKIAELTKKVSKSKKQTKKATKETKNKPEVQEPIEEGFTL